MSTQQSRSIRRTLAPFLLTLGVGLGVGGGCGSKETKSAEPAKVAPEQKPGLKHGLTEEQAKKVIAKVGDTSITLGDFAERLGNNSPYLRARYTSPERRREFLDNMVRFELLAMEAKKRGLDKAAEVDRMRRQMMVQQMMKEMFDDNGIKLSDITEAEIKAFYDANPAEFHKPGQRRASHILFKDKAKAQAALTKLQTAAAAAAKLAEGGKVDPAGASAEDDMELFRRIAKDSNQDPETKDRLGDLRFFSKDPLPGEAAPNKAVRDAVFSLSKTGELGPEVVASEQGFHIVKLTGERAAIDRTLDDARRLIQNRLWRQKREAAIEKFVADLRAKAEVKENLALLSQVKINTDAPLPEPGAKEPGAKEPGAKEPGAQPTKPAAKPKSPAAAAKAGEQ